MATNNFSLNNISTTNSTNLIAKSGGVGAHGTTRVVQKIVNVGGKQVILTGSAANSNHDLKRHSFDNVSGLSPRKIFCPNVDAANRQVVSILPSTSLSSLQITSSAIKTQGTTTANINAISNTTGQQVMPGSGTILNNKTISFATNSLGSGDRKSITLSPQKVIIKGQPVTVNYNQQNVLLQQINSQKSLANSVGNAGSVQPISVQGNKLQYVRVVNSQAQNSGHPGAKIGSVAQTVAQRSIAPAITMSSTAVTSKVPIMPHTQANKSSHQVTPQRLILPATSQVPVRSSTSSSQQQQQQQQQQQPSQQQHSAPLGAQALTQLPPGTTIISSGQNLQGVQGFALVPAQYVTQLQQQFNPQVQQQQQHQPALQQVPSQQSHHSYSVRQESYTSEQPRPPSAHSQKNSVGNDGAAVRTRKPCNCTKSQCLKLYCECFANGEFCSGCNCNNCYNNLDHEDERARAIKQCLDRNPNAFRPKIGKDRTSTGSRRHNKGCNCKRSGCLKNYCECYEAKILCSHLCRCVGCKNFEESPEKKTLMHLADAAEVRVQQQTAAKTKLSSQIEDIPPRLPPPPTGERLPYSFVTTEVAEATCSCLIAQIEEAERTRQIELIQEKRILEEFGRCLMQVIESSNRTKESGPL